MRERKTKRGKSESGRERQADRDTERNTEIYVLLISNDPTEA